MVRWPDGALAAGNLSGDWGRLYILDDRVRLWNWVAVLLQAFDVQHDRFCNQFSRLRAWSQRQLHIRAGRERMRHNHLLRIVR